MGLFSLSSPIVLRKSNVGLKQYSTLENKSSGQSKTRPHVSSADASTSVAKKLKTGSMSAGSRLEEKSLEQVEDSFGMSLSERPLDFR